MALTINVTLVGERELIARIGAMPSHVRAALVAKVTELGLKLEAKVKGKLSGQVLQVRTGALRRSIFFSMAKNSSEAVIGKVASAGDVKYAAIHEFGGKTPPHVIVPVKGQALHFFINGKEMFLKRVNHPGSNIPERSYLRSSLGDMRDDIALGLKEAIREGLQAQ